MTREDIEQLNVVEPYCFESDKEELWYNVGLKNGLEIADEHPKSPWIKYKDKLPPEGIEVIAFHHKWIDEDLNPNGTRVGFLNGDHEFISAFRWDEQDCYETIDRERCAGNESFYRYYLDNTEPEIWTPIPNIPNIIENS